MASEGVMETHAIPFRIVMQSPSEYILTSGMSHHADMHDRIRQNLRHLIGERSVKGVAEDADIGQSWLQRFMNPDEKSGIRKPNAEKLAAVAAYFGYTYSDLTDRDLASSGPIPAGETPPGYLRFQLLEGAGGMGSGVVNQDYPEVIREVNLAAWEVRRKLGFLPEPGRIRLLTGRGPSMRPMIENGDVVMVDTSVLQFDGDGVYVINLGGETQIKMLQMRGDGLYVVSANADYPAYLVQKDDVMHVGGRVAAVMGIKEF